MRTLHCFFSGGRDSALACYIAHKVAKARVWDFRLVFINTTIAVQDTLDYVRMYADWLDAELIELRPKRSFEELVVRFSWPLLLRSRWCYYRLKLGPIIEYLIKNYKKGDLVVFGIRRSESLRRLSYYNKVFTNKCYDNGPCVHVWYPILHLSDIDVGHLVKKFNIPINPVWYRIGTSGECLCLAGTTEKTLIRIAIHYPSVMEKLVEIDKKVQANKGGYPGPLVGKKITLTEWYEKLKKQSRIDDYLTKYNTCQLGCMIE